MTRLELEDVAVDIPLRGVGVAVAEAPQLIRTPDGELAVRALAGVSLALVEGDRVGLWGPNGAGKTTLLRACAGWLPLASGSIRVTGAVQAIIDLTQGIRGALSGRENARLRYHLLGEPGPSAAGFIDEVAAFADLGGFFDLPVNSYSPGMLSRLLFAMGTACHADILLMDEWLGVSDESFREKAARRLEALVSRHDILVVASHDRALLSRVADRVLTIEAGRLVEA